MKEYDYQRRIMGADASITLIADERAKADAAADRLFALAETWDQQFTRFDAASELSRLNRDRILSVSPVFMQSLLEARALFERSGGAFNPLVDISRFGYDADIKEVKGQDRDGTDERTPYDIDFASVAIDESTMTVSLGEGQHLDFGGFLKGKAAEAMAREAADCAGVIVNMGGDLYTSGVGADGAAFSFTIDNPINPSAPFIFTARDAGVATSGTYNRHWKYRGAPFAHILDQSGKQNPHTDIVSSTVIAPSGLEADAYATAALVRGVQHGAHLLDSLGFAYHFILADGTTRSSAAFPFVAPELHPYA